MKRTSYLKAQNGISLSMRTAGVTCAYTKQAYQVSAFDQARYQTYGWWSSQAARPL
jgi:hypothetical protein